jgi:hypothetical protein
MGADGETLVGTGVATKAGLAIFANAKCCVRAGVARMFKLNADDWVTVHAAMPITAQSEVRARNK